MNVLKIIRDYIATCPLLRDGAILSVDKLDVEAVAYTLDAVPCDPVIKNYADGGQMRQFQFVFASREAYGTDVLENIENSGFYEDFTDWIEQNNAKGLSSIIDLGERRKAIRIEISSAPYIYDAEENTARYQVQLNLIYYQNWRYFYNG